MKKNYFLLFLAITLFAGKSVAQKTVRCASDEVRQKLIATHPEILQAEERFKQQIKDGLTKIDFSKVARTTNDSNPGEIWYDIPVVVHVVHDYGVEYLSDNEIFNDLEGWNKVYAGENYEDTADIVKPFKKWVGNPRIRLHLATKDAFGNPTKGITRDRSYLTYQATDNSKISDWPNTSYLNIWFTNTLQGQNGFSPAAYAYFPSTGDAIPYYDGVICLHDYAANFHSGPVMCGYTINHEVGHYFSLYHVWGNNNGAAAGTCADGGTDDVDDTPPTIGHLDYSNLYDTTCATGYYVIYNSVLHPGVDSMVNYPDTTNVQNIMDYSYADRMFTMGQANRMHDALNSDVGHRSNLWSPFNLGLTGALAPTPDLPAIPDFAATPLTSSSMNPPQYFIGCNNHSNAKLKFVNESWNDTVSYTRWQFSNGALISDTTTHQYVNFITNGFTQPGWVNITMTVTDTSGQSVGRPNQSGTKTFTNSVFVADSVGTPGDGYYQEFDPSGDIAKWPTFNYYNNEFKWVINNSVGYFDNHCMSYLGFDTRLNPVMNIYPPTGAPGGDFDDFYTIPFDLSSYDSSSPCNLNFMYTGASRSSTGLNVNDSMEIQYSTDGAKSWHNLLIMKKGVLENKGALSYSYVPTSMSDWAPMSIALPKDGRNLRGGYTLFRFRYHPGEGTDGNSSGNNFYIDRINFSKFSAEVSTVKTDGASVVVVPNPTSGNAYVVVNDKNATTAQIIVTDITGKVVYTTGQQMIGIDAHIEIPQSAISVKGIYMVKTITGGNINTQKLVVY